MSLPNYPVFEQNGNLFVSDSGGWHENNGCIYRISASGEARVVSTMASAFPNGMALSPDNRSLYVVLSNLPGVVKLALNDDGSVGAPHRVVELPGCVPDGVAFDEQGTLYISCYVPDLIYRLSTRDELAVLLEDPERTLIAAPTNIAFVGNDRETLAVSNYGGWHLTAVKLSSLGTRLHYPSAIVGRE
jgi:gluconolactonase